MPILLHWLCLLSRSACLYSDFVRIMRALLSCSCWISLQRTSSRIATNKYCWLVCVSGCALGSCFFCHWVLYYFQRSRLTRFSYKSRFCLCGPSFCIVHAFDITRVHFLVWSDLFAENLYPSCYEQELLAGLCVDARKARNCACSVQWATRWHSLGLPLRVGLSCSFLCAPYTFVYCFCCVGCVHHTGVCYNTIVRGPSAGF